LLQSVRGWQVSRQQALRLVLRHVRWNTQAFPALSRCFRAGLNAPECRLIHGRIAGRDPIAIVRTHTLSRAASGAIDPLTAE